jgi:hypothetical protein
MFISRIINYFDEVDPYFLHRILAYKSLYAATLLVYVYWIFKPTSFMGYFSPFLLAFLYENPAVATQQEKEKLLVYIYSALIILSVSFYLLFPFPFIFLIYAVIALYVFYFSSLALYPQLKNITMSTLCISAMVLTIQPYANLQEVSNYVYGNILAILTVFFAFKTSPNLYLYTWRLAMCRFLRDFEKDIITTVELNQYIPTKEMYHLQMIRYAQRLIPKGYAGYTQQMLYHLRNAQLAMDSIYFEREIDGSWGEVGQQLAALRSKIKHWELHELAPESDKIYTSLQRFEIMSLNKAVENWNEICKMHHYIKNS